MKIRESSTIFPECTAVTEIRAEPIIVHTLSKVMATHVPQNTYFFPKSRMLLLDELIANSYAAEGGGMVPSLSPF